MSRTVHTADAWDGVEPAHAGCGVYFDVARSVEEVEAAWQLVYQDRRRAGLVGVDPTGVLSLRQALGQHSAVIVGRMWRLTVCTITAVADNPGGLPLDEIHGKQLQALRRDGRHLIEIAFFADRRKSIDRSFFALIELMRHVFSYGQCVGATDFVWEVPIEHVSFYHHAFGFEPIEHEPDTGRDGHAWQLVHLAADIEHRALYRIMNELMDNPVPSAVFDGRFGFEEAALRGSTILARFDQ